MPEKEAKARIKINKLFEMAGWLFFPEAGVSANIQLEPSVKIKVAELDALGNDFEKTTKGFIDFLLLDSRGFPLIVLEAKSENKTPLVGKEQARKYARSQNCRFVIMSNGNLHYFWDLDRGNPYIITSFPTPDSVMGYRKMVPDPRRLIEETVGEDSLAVIASKRSGPLRIPGAEGLRILSWDEVQDIVDRFESLNPYDRQIVKGSILNLVDANYVDSDDKKPRRQLYGYSISAKRYALYEKIGKTEIQIIDPKAHGIGFLYPPKNSPKKWKEDVAQWIYEMWDYIVRGALKLRRKAPTWLDVPQMMRFTITTHNVLDRLGDWEVARPYNFLLMPMVDPLFGYAFDRPKNQKIMLVTAFSSKQKRWFDLECINIHGRKKYRMVNSNKEKNPPHNVVLPSQFGRLLIEYQEHPEAKSLAPDGAPCKSDTTGLLGRAHIVAGELRYIGKESEYKWGEGDHISVREAKTTEFGRSKMVVASEEVKSEIEKIGIKKCARESGFARFVLRKLLRGRTVRRNSYDEFLRWLQGYKSRADKIAPRKIR